MSKKWIPRDKYLRVKNNSIVHWRSNGMNKQAAAQKWYQFAFKWIQGHRRQSGYFADLKGRD